MKNNHIYRYERKYFISDINDQEVETIINFHPAMFSEIFYKRSVNNIYFDSPGLQNYFDNVSGNMERKKTRIRWYGELFDNIAKPVLELKIKKGLLGRKLSYLLYPFRLDSHFNMQNIIQNEKIPEIIKTGLNSSQPVLLNRYSRKYFLSADKRYRITIDTDQVFYEIGLRNNSFLNKLSDDINVILELKYNMNFDDDANHITKHFPFRLTKSSKYVTGVEKIYVH